MTLPFFGKCWLGLLFYVDVCCSTILAIILVDWILEGLQLAREALPILMYQGSDHLQIGTLLLRLGRSLLAELPLVLHHQLFEISHFSKDAN
jgi:hypothetical protein